jgi:hypothetical protein
LQLNNCDFIYSIKGPQNTILPDVIDPIGLLGIKAVMGIWMGLGLLAMIPINIYVAMLFLIPIFIAKCTGVFVGLAIALPFYFWYKKRSLFYIATLLIIVGGIIYGIFVDSPMGMMKTRIPMWKLVMKDTVYSAKFLNKSNGVMGNIFTGCGPDGFRVGPILYVMNPQTQETLRALRTPTGFIYVQGRPFTINNGALTTADGVRVDVWDDPHNEFIHLFYDFGLFGCIMVGFALYYLSKRFIASNKTVDLVLVAS